MGVQTRHQTTGPALARRRLVVGIFGCFALALGVVFASDASETPVLPDGGTGLWRAVVHQCGGPATGIVPRVLVADSQEFRQAAREVMAKRAGGNPDLNMAAVRRVLAFYSPITGAAYIRRDFVRACPLANTAKEIGIVIESIVFHEFVHAWQYRNLPIVETEKKADALALDALLEGHARFCTERFAQEKKGKGWKKVQARIRARYRQMARWSHAPNASGGDVSFFYVDGYRFIRAMAEAKPPLSIKDVFKRGLPTQRQVIFPEEYLKGFNPKLLDMKPIDAELIRQTKAGTANKAKVAPFQFVDMRLMLYRSGFTKFGIKTACRNYRGGRRIEQSGQASAVFAFAPTKPDFLPVYVRRCTSERLVNLDVRVKHGHRLNVPEPAAATTDAWVTPAWDEQIEQPAKAKDGKPLPPSMHAVFAGKHLYILSEWKTAPKSDKDALKVLLTFVDRCRKADAECAKFFKDESGDDEWD